MTIPSRYLGQLDSRGQRCDSTGRTPGIDFTGSSYLVTKQNMQKKKNSTSSAMRCDLGLSTAAPLLPALYECKLAIASRIRDASLYHVPRPSRPLLHTASDQKLEVYRAWERG